MARPSCMAVTHIIEPNPQFHPAAIFRNVRLLHVIGFWCSKIRFQTSKLRQRMSFVYKNGRMSSAGLGYKGSYLSSAKNISGLEDGFPWKYQKAIILRWWKTKWIMVCSCQYSKSGIDDDATVSRDGKSNALFELHDQNNIDLWAPVWYNPESTSLSFEQLWNGLIVKITLTTGGSVTSPRNILRAVSLHRWNYPSEGFFLRKTHRPWTSKHCSGLISKSGPFWPEWHLEFINGLVEYISAAACSPLRV
jgi:hypothetical protein